MGFLSIVGTVTVVVGGRRLEGFPGVVHYFVRSYGFIGPFEKKILTKGEREEVNE